MEVNTCAINQTEDNYYYNNENKELNDLTSKIYVFQKSRELGMEPNNEDSSKQCKESSRKNTKIRTYIWQRAPSAFASLTCVSYGLMLGWPSPTYPKFLEPNSTITINYAEMAMVAGFLMLGMCIGTPFSLYRTRFGPKFGIIAGNTLIMIGWILMWQAESKLWLLASRLVLGAGNGYAMGQIKIYIQEMCDELTTPLTKLINIYVLIGFVAAFAVAPSMSFGEYSRFCVLFSSVVFFVQIFLTPTPKELINANKIKDAKKLLLFLNPECDAEERTKEIYKNRNTCENTLGFTKIMRKPSLRNNFFKITTLCFVSQFSGAPATLVFTQLFFKNTSVPYPQYIALLYAVWFFISNLLGIYGASKYNKKYVLLFSSVCVSLSLLVNILVIFYKLNEIYFNYSSVITMLIFIFVHTVGLGTMPMMLVNDFFPKNCRLFVSKYVICLLSIFALIATKIFQVLFFDFSIETPFYLFLSVSLFGTFFAAIFIPKNIVPEVENMRFINVNSNSNMSNGNIQNKL